MKDVSVYLDGILIKRYPITTSGEYIGGPLTTDEEYARAAQLTIIEDGLLSAEDATRADYAVEGEIIDP